MGIICTGKQTVLICLSLRKHRFRLGERGKKKRKSTGAAGGAAGENLYLHNKGLSVILMMY